MLICRWGTLYQYNKKLRLQGLDSSILQFTCIIITSANPLLFFIQWDEKKYKCLLMVFSFFEHHQIVFIENEKPPRCDIQRAHPCIKPFTFKQCRGDKFKYKSYYFYCYFAFSHSLPRIFGHQMCPTPKNYFPSPESNKCNQYEYCSQALKYYINAPCGDILARNFKYIMKVQINIYQWGFLCFAKQH